MALRSDRIYQELRELESTVEGFKPLRVANDCSWALVGLQGPTGTPYERGDFIVTVSFPAGFPNQAPRVYFQTKIWHVNVCQITGLADNLRSICNWTPNASLVMVFKEMFTSLVVPNLEAVQDYWAAKMYERNRDMYNSTAAVWCRWYANGVVCRPAYEEKVFSLLREGATIEEALVLLTDSCWNLNDALDKLAHLS